MLNNYKYSFTEGSGRLIFVPTLSSRSLGRKLHRDILRRWSPPDYFYHFKEGGHVAAARVHLTSGIFVRLDLHRFYDSITRSKVHRALRDIKFRQKDAWHISCQSTVSKNKIGGPFSLPFGFVQSPVLSSLVLSSSALGKTLSILYVSGIKLSVYMDDIIMSGDNSSSLAAAMLALENAARTAGFQFNISKSFGPAPALEAFNLDLSHRTLVVSASRMANFAAAMITGNSITRNGILGYVGTVNIHQRAELASL